MMDIIDFAIVASLILATLICYHIIILRFKKKEANISKGEYSLLKAILTEFKHRIDEQNKKISEIMVKVDLLENKVEKYPIKKDIIREDRIQDRFIQTGELKEDIGLSGIEQSILRFISTGPKSSREVQLTIKKSREHTARLLKSLYSKNLLNRESQGKFFVYSLSEQGKKIISGS